jgi:hypothetical protein
MRRRGLLTTLPGMPGGSAVSARPEPSMSASSLAAAATTANDPSRTLRFDLHGNVHKALRHQLADALLHLGRADAQDLVQAVDRTAALLEALRRHAQYAVEQLYPRIEAHQPGRCALLGAHARDQLQAIDALVHDIAELRRLASPAALRPLYRALARFAARVFVQMDAEEQQLDGVDDDALLRDGTDAQRAQLLHWMLPAQCAAERAAAMRRLQQQLPPESMRALLDAARRRLDDSQWARLARDLGLAPVPGLATC